MINYYLWLSFYYDKLIVKSHFQALIPNVMNRKLSEISIEINSGHNYDKLVFSYVSNRERIGNGLIPTPKMISRRYISNWTIQICRSIPIESCSKCVTSKTPFDDV